MCSRERVRYTNEIPLYSLAPSKKKSNITLHTHTHWLTHEKRHTHNSRQREKITPKKFLSLAATQSPPQNYFNHHRFFSPVSRESVMWWKKKGATRRRRERGREWSNSRFLLHGPHVKLCRKKRKGFTYTPLSSSSVFLPLYSLGRWYIYWENFYYFLFFFKHKSRRRRSSLFLAYGVCPYGRSLQYKENELGRALVVK